MSRCIKRELYKFLCGCSPLFIIVAQILILNYVIEVEVNEDWWKYPECTIQPQELQDILSFILLDIVVLTPLVIFYAKCLAEAEKEQERGEKE